MWRFLKLVTRVVIKHSILSNVFYFNFYCFLKSSVFYMLLICYSKLDIAKYNITFNICYISWIVENRCFWVIKINSEGCSPTNGITVYLIKKHRLAMVIFQTTFPTCTFKKIYYCCRHIWCLYTGGKLLKCVVESINFSTFFV